MKSINKIISKIFLLLLLLCSCNVVFAYQDAVSEEDMQYADSAYRQGLEYVQSRAYESALEAFRQAIQYNPYMTDAYYNIASIYVYQKKYNEAYNVYTKIIAMNPNDYDSILQAAKISYNRKDYALAMKYLKYIPDDYEKYYIVRQLYNDANELFTQQKNRVERAKISAASKSKSVIIDKFSSPAGVVVDSDGNMIVASYSENAIVKYDTEKKVKTNFVKDYLLDGPIGLAIDNYDNIYVANYDGNNVLKITKGGNVSVFMENVSKPYFLYIKDDILYVSEQGNDAVLMYNLASG